MALDHVLRRVALGEALDDREGALGVTRGEEAAELVLLLEEGRKLGPRHGERQLGLEHVAHARAQAFAFQVARVLDLQSVPSPHISR